jgi:hypothetical protein
MCGESSAITIIDINCQMCSTDESSKSASSPSIIDPSSIERTVPSVETVIVNASTEIDKAHSTLNDYGGRLASVGKFAAYKEEGPGKKVQIKTNPDVASPPKGMYDGNNDDDVAFVVQQYFAENLPLRPGERMHIRNSVGLYAEIFIEYEPIDLSHILPQYM